VIAALRSSTIVVASWVALLAGCDVASRMADSEAHAGPIEAEIELAVGKKVRVYSSSTGPFLVVMVRFEEVPAVPVPAIEAVARQAIVHEFKKEPDSLTISFVYDDFAKPK
jgi:hypothetical protein